MVQGGDGFGLAGSKRRRRKDAELFGTPVALFRTVLPGAGAILGGYDVAPDGQRFLLGELIGEPSNPIPTVVPNWPGLLSK